VWIVQVLVAEPVVILVIGIEVVCASGWRLTEGVDVQIGVKTLLNEDTSMGKMGRWENRKVVIVLVMVITKGVSIVNVIIRSCHRRTLVVNLTRVRAYGLILSKDT
jgi:hypothetical protein